jgi:hypothetical protein
LTKHDDPTWLNPLAVNKNFVTGLQWVKVRMRRQSFNPSVPPSLQLIFFVMHSFFAG